VATRLSQHEQAAVAEHTASKRTALQAAAGDVLSSDTPGLLSTVVLGPLVQDLNFLRPTVNAVGARAYPDNGQQKTFIRPTITTHTSVATQSTELSSASATTMVIASNSVSKDHTCWSSHFVGSRHGLYKSCSNAVDLE
jgi:hypothetical protein